MLRSLVDQTNENVAGGDWVLRKTFQVFQVATVVAGKKVGHVPTIQLQVRHVQRGTREGRGTVE